MIIIIQNIKILQKNIFIIFNRKKEYLNNNIVIQIYCKIIFIYTNYFLFKQVQLQHLFALLLEQGVLLLPFLLLLYTVWIVVF